MSETKSTILRVDFFLSGFFLLLLGVGLATHLSASYLSAEFYRHDPYYYFKTQLTHMGFGWAALALFALIPTRELLRASVVLAVGSALLLLLPFIPGLGVSLNGASRWARIGGVSLQPSEFAKLGVVLYMAYSLARKGRLAEGFWYGFVPHSLVLGVFGLLIVMEKDLGGAVVLGIIVVALSFAGGLKKRYLLAYAALAAVACFFLVTQYSYRLDRLEGWRDPYADPQGVGYPILHSYYAFANGGIFGAGLGASVEKRFYIPEVQTDYVFAVVGEEMGLIGVLFVAGLFLLFCLRGLVIARAARDLGGRYLAIGATLMIGVPAFVNMAVALSLVPAKGLALPFFSQGGSNLVASMAAVGLILNVARESGRAEAAPGGGDREAWRPAPLKLVTGQAEAR
ncbi:MAG: putative lipid II flippase FtsW [Deltaproteobacteria bacterium]|jgi:cell division protein FtsW|nr:putative lipid II flippase FtsW [Deltaproteobacteria bacterium]